MIHTVLMYCTLSSDLYFLLLDMLNPAYRKNNKVILLINMGELGHATLKFSFALARKVQVGACCDGGI
jgi:NADH/NAD ratio-sensing transcriptional regulator Rex